MAYVKNTWVTGDTITAEKLNHMENGIEGVGVFSLYPVTLDYANEAYTLDKTPQEVKTAILAGKTPVLIQTSDGVRNDMAVVFPMRAEVYEGELSVIWATPDIGTVPTTAGSPPSTTKAELYCFKVTLDDYALVVEWIQGAATGEYGSPTRYEYPFD